MKQKAVATTILAACILAVSPVAAMDAIAHEVIAKKASVKSAMSESGMKAKKDNAQPLEENLNEQVKAALETVKKVMPDLQSYSINEIFTGVQKTQQGEIEIVGLELRGEPGEPYEDSLGVALVAVNAKTGELIGADIQNGFPSLEEPLEYEQAMELARDYLEQVYGDQAKQYEVEKVRSYFFGINKEKAQTNVSFQGPEDTIHLVLDNNGDLKRILKDIYSENNS